MIGYVGLILAGLSIVCIVLAVWVWLLHRRVERLIEEREWWKAWFVSAGLQMTPATRDAAMARIRGES